MLNSSVKKLIDIVLRTLAVFTANGLSVVGAAVLVGVPPLKAVFMAGLTGVVTVTERILRAYIAEGDVKQDEINAAFSQVDSRSKTIEDLLVARRKKQG